MLFKRFKQLFFLLTNLALSSLANIGTERNMMIFWDCGYGESLYAKVQAGGNLMGPVTTESLMALYQEPGAILISTNTLRNILTLGKLFHDFSENDINTIKKIYDKFENLKDDLTVQELSKGCKYVKENHEKLLELLENSSTKEEFYKRIQEDNFFEYEQTREFFSLRGPTLFLMCAYFPFDRFIIKKLGIHGYLFIPRSYLKKLQIDPSSFHKTTQRVGIDESEIKLGLKINHLPSITEPTLKDLEDEKKMLIKNKPKDLGEKKCRQFLVSLLDEIFVKRTEVKDDLLLEPWAIYWSSHGMFNLEFNKTVSDIQKIKIEIEQEQKQINDLKQLLEEKKKNIPGYEKSKESRNASLNIQALNHAKLEKVFDLRMYQWKKKDSKPKVAGLTLKQFKQTLNFFNNKISTGFLFYTSCYAGGQLAIDAYKSETKNQSSSFNYTIATDSSFDVPTRKEIAITPLSFYFNKQENIFKKKRLDKIINFDEKRIILNSNLKYNDFFSQLANFPLRSSSYLELFTNINPLLKRFKARLSGKAWVEALPSIRFPGTTWFNTVELPKQVEILTRVKVLVRGNEPLSIDQNINEKHALLLYTKKIPFEITIKASPEKIFPTIVSMNPGTAIHILNSLNASEFNLSQIVSSFAPFSRYAGSKLFHIKKLTVLGNGKFGTTKGKPAIFNDVMIVYNGKLKEDDSFRNFIFFKEPSYHVVFSYKWQSGSYLPYDFYKEFDTGMHKDYKNQLLTYFAKREAQLLGEKFSGILETTEGQEKVNLEKVKELFKKRAEQLKEIHLKKSIQQLNLLTQSLTNLEAQQYRITHHQH